MKTAERYIPGIVAIVLMVSLLAAYTFNWGSSSSTAAEASAPGAQYEVSPRIRGTIEPAASDAEAVSSVELPALGGTEEAQLTYAPEVPPVIQRTYAARVIVNLETVEVVKELADGVAYEFWTFGGETPGPMIRVREGDLVEFRLGNNPNSSVPHNIDLHALTGTGGGAEGTLVAPGKEATMAFRALKPGLYVYHCATPPVGQHIANGMYGLIHVQPKEGVPEADREYYVMQSEFYTEGGFQEAGLQSFSHNKALEENPAYVVFNGGVGSLTGENALQATVGETVRLYVGNGGPNLTSSFHVIGEIFDEVYTEGGSQINQRDVQTTLVPAGGATVVEFEIDVPGTYKLVDHAIFRAINKGAVGVLNAVGPENENIYSERIDMKDYVPKTGDPSVTAN